MILCARLYMAALTAIRAIKRKQRSSAQKIELGKRLTHTGRSPKQMKTTSNGFMPIYGLGISSKTALAVTDRGMITLLDGMLATGEVAAQQVISQ